MKAEIIMHTFGSDPSSIHCEILNFDPPVILENYTGAQGETSLIYGWGELQVAEQAGLVPSHVAAVQINNIVYEVSGANVNNGIVTLPLRRA